MVYNQALHQSEAAYRGGQKLSISQISQLWTPFKAAHPEHADIPSSSACNTVHDRDINAAVNVLDYARRNRVQDVEGDTNAEVLRRPVKRQPLEDHSLPLTMSGGG